MDIDPELDELWSTKSDKEVMDYFDQLADLTEGTEAIYVSQECYDRLELTLASMFPSINYDGFSYLFYRYHPVRIYENLGT